MVQRPPSSARTLRLTTVPPNPRQSVRSPANSVEFFTRKIPSGPACRSCSTWWDRHQPWYQPVVCPDPPSVQADLRPRLGTARLCSRPGLFCGCPRPVSRPASSPASPASAFALRLRRPQVGSCLSRCKQQNASSSR